MHAEENRIASHHPHADPNHEKKNNQTVDVRPDS
jgi:hypothetical protein